MEFLSQNRYKEIPPLDTVQKIRSILHGLGIYTIERWTDSKVDGCYSLRVEISGTGIGQNGKGSTPEFALASAYAELMERVQNDLAYTGDYDQGVWEHCGYYQAPDERLMSTRELADEDNPWVDTLLKLFRQKDDENIPGSGLLNSVAARLFSSDAAREAACESLKLWSFSKPAGCKHDFVCIPFYSLKTDRLYYMPVSVLRAIYGSNGTCAGNTPEEALVQGLSELFERHANVNIINNRLTPPSIPDWYLSKFERLYGVIRLIESMGNYRVIVKDCSLGSGFPVIASILIDLNSRNYVIKFGAHPVFEIAFERSLTEMFQGRDISTAVKACRISAGFEDVARPHNLHNILKVASGQYPAEFFSENCDSEFTPFHENAGKSNRELLEFAVNKLIDKGYDIMIRDVSFLGLCSFQIVVPGYSEVFNFGTQRLREKKTLDSVKKIIRRLPAASEGDVEKLVRYLFFKRDWILENSLDFNSGLPLKPDVPGSGLGLDFLLAVCCYRLGRLEEAYRGFRYVAAYMKRTNDNEADYYACLRDYVGAVLKGFSPEDAMGFLNKFYTADILDRVASHIGKPHEVLKQLYTSLDCFNCDSCPAKKRCSYKVVRNVKLKLKERYLENRIDQRKAGRAIKGLIS